MDTKKSLRRVGILSILALILLACNLPCAWPWFLPDMNDVQDFLSSPTPMPQIGDLAVTPVAELPVVESGEGVHFDMPQPISGLPELINHPQPDLPVDSSSFVDPNNLAAEMGCGILDEVWPYLGGLNPAVPMMDCSVSTHPGDEEVQSVFTLSCLNQFHHSYVIMQDGKPTLIDSPEAFISQFAPVQSPEEALSFAIGLTGLDAFFNQSVNTEFRYFSPILEDTYVIEGPDGYIVRLFDTFLCGCGPHTVWAVDVLVMRDGAITVGVRQPLYEDPAMDDLCID